MPPFVTPTVVLTGFKERVESLLVQGDRLYVGTAVGNLHILEVGNGGNNEIAKPKVVEIKQSLTRRSIEQLGYIKDISSLIVLSEATVTLFPLPRFAPPTPLAKAKGALSFALHTAIQHLRPDGTVSQPSDGDFSQAKALPSVVTILAVGCKRRIVFYSWKDGESQDVKETVLPHSPRAMTFINHDVLCLAYTLTDYAIFHLPSLTVTDVVTPTAPVAKVAGLGMGMGMGAITGLFGAQVKPTVVSISDTEVLIAKDNHGYFVGADGKLSRSDRFEWPAPPEDMAYIKPYVLSTLPPGSVPIPGSNDSSTTVSTTSVYSSAAIQIRSSLSLAHTQTCAFPFSAELTPATPDTHTLRLPTSSPLAKAPLFLITSPNDRTTLAAEGSTLWMFLMKPWSDQLDEMVKAGAYDEALALLDTIDEAVLSDKEKRRTLMRGLSAVAQFRVGQYDAAMDTFIQLDVNPAKVVALYSDEVAGRLSVPPDEWIALFGGPVSLKADNASMATTTAIGVEGPKDEIPASIAASSSAATTSGSIGRSSPMGSIKESLKSGLDAIMPSGSKDDDTASIRSQKKVQMAEKASRKSIETLIRYLSDRRPKIRGALDALRISPGQTKISFLSEASIDDVFGLPNAPLSALTPEQLVRFAQIVDTALFKSYLVVRPGLLGPLCRVENWCEVTEVEEELRARGKFAELIYLYNGKKMHAKALDLLRHLSENETDMREKLQPSITYLQRLGPDHLDQIFQSSQWIFQQDSNMAFEIFTSEEAELPREPVADFLESLDLKICARFLEYLIDEREEHSPYFHDRLAELYLRMSIAAKRKSDDPGRNEAYRKLLHFIDTTDYYHTDRLFGLLPSEDLFEARAILLGRLGRHEHALELYVYRLKDYIKAEEYCKRIYQPGTPTSQVYLSLLRIYLRPTVKTSGDLLRPALDLISRHSPRIDPVETLQLLPPLVTAQDLRTFLMEALRAPLFDTSVVREVCKAREEQVSRKLMVLQGNRVKVTDSRICPQCHKRIGNSVIAVHAPRGEVTHYQCREAFSRRLKEMRL